MPCHEFQAGAILHPFIEIAKAIIVAQPLTLSVGPQRKKRTSRTDLVTRPKALRLTVVSIQEEAVIVSFRRYTLSPLGPFATLSMEKYEDRAKNDNSADDYWHADGFAEEGKAEEKRCW